MLANAVDWFDKQQQQQQTPGAMAPAVRSRDIGKLAVNRFSDYSAQVGPTCKRSQHSKEGRFDDHLTALLGFGCFESRL